MLVLDTIQHDCDASTTIYKEEYKIPINPTMFEESLSTLVKTELNQTFTSIVLKAQNQINYIDYLVLNNITETNGFVKSSSYTRDQIIKELISFRSLENNWDGHSSIPLEVESTANAIRLLDLIGSKIFNSIKEIYPNPHGTISYVWEGSKGQTLSLEIGNSSMSYFVEPSEGDITYRNERPINHKEAWEISEHLKHF